MINEIRNWIGRMKVYMNRSGSYMSIINMGMILHLFVSDLDKDNRLANWIIPIWILLLSSVFFFGYLEVKFGFFRAEQRINVNNNPQVMKILKKIDNLEKIMNKK